MKLCVTCVNPLESSRAASNRDEVYIDCNGSHKKKTCASRRVCRAAWAMRRLNA
jgi:hypothetical protein